MEVKNDRTFVSLLIIATLYCLVLTVMCSQDSSVNSKPNASDRTGKQFFYVSPPVVYSSPQLQRPAVYHPISYERQFFGVANLFSSQCPNNTCPQCPATNSTCPEPCPSTTTPIVLPTIVIASGECGILSTNVNTNFAKCTRVSAAPSGSFMVTFSAPLSTAPTGANTYPTATVFIITTCPNTRITLACGIIPPNYIVMSSRGQINQPTTGPTATESGSMQLVIGQSAPISPSIAATISCSWIAS